MLHAKKMHLVPYYDDDNDEISDSLHKSFLPVTKDLADDKIDTKQDNYFRLVNAETVQTPGTPLTRLDKEMHVILNSSHADDREKWLKYREILQKYLHNLPAKSTSQQKSVSDQKQNENPLDARVTDDEILNTVPAKFKTKAKKLLDFARGSGNIDWNDKGVVTVNGKEIKGHITDLVNDAVRFRKTFSATGRKPFSQALRRAGLPHEFVGNNQFWREGSFLTAGNTNNDTLNRTSASTSYRDSVSHMNIDTSTSSASETPPATPRHAQSFVRPVIRNPVLNGPTRASRKRALEQSNTLNRTKIRKRPCIFQPAKRNYGSAWKRL